jgi:hypothetical protein
MGVGTKSLAPAGDRQNMRVIRQPDKPTDWWSAFTVIFVALMVLILLLFLSTTPLHGL